ncbi:PQQ-binding-like beta-propeller repeat protein [Micromonospora sp. WMMD1102]|uniref:outer membrane protein assembly factor BamB family protein n=1 Tax=Micromonospora sp. WMMD1102 TaxID=3016105 RepID=UPI002415965A|nr:PQQ-binding-like beta-propeller repeat protein [Micromonospora sp. WMMD1102]MDG4785855.1 PQQ-binding-like beta-propeller repeat protein [Micromonospora sp. WMMD1102]
MRTIELGELPAGSGGQPTGPDRTAGHRTAVHRSDRRRTARRRAVRPGLLGAMLIVVLGTVAAGNPFPRPWPETVLPARLGATVLADRDWLIVSEPDRSGPGGRDGRELVAYELPAVEPRWRLSPPDGVDDVQVLGDRVLLTTYPEASLGRNARLTVLDVRTGTLAWERQAILMVSSDGGDLVLWTTAEDRRPGVPAGSGRLEAVDPATGAVRWSLPVPDGVLPHFDATSADPTALARASTLVLALPSGLVEVRDLGTGAVVRPVRLPVPVTASPPRFDAEVIAGMFLMYDESTVTGYQLPELDRRWSMRTDPEMGRGPVACGADLCSLYPQQGIRVWDPRTGATRWSDGRWTRLWTIGDALVAAQGSGPSGTLAVLDPATGRVLADLGALGHLTPRGSQLDGVRYGADRRAWVLEFDPATWRARPLAVLSEVSGDCRLSATVLHCRRVDASIGVWRLPG